MAQKERVNGSMMETSDTKKLSDAVNAMVVTVAEIINDKLRVAADVQEQRIARKMIEPMLTKKDLADHLRVSVRSIEAWMSKGHLPYYRLGKIVRFRLSEIDSYWNERYRVRGGGWGRGPNRARRGV